MTTAVLFAAINVIKFSRYNFSNTVNSEKQNSLLSSSSSVITIIVIIVIIVMVTTYIAIN